MASWRRWGLGGDRRPFDDHLGRGGDLDRWDGGAGGGPARRPETVGRIGLTDQQGRSGLLGPPGLGNVPTGRGGSGAGAPPGRRRPGVRGRPGRRRPRARDQLGVRSGGRPPVILRGRPCRAGTGSRGRRRSRVLPVLDQQEGDDEHGAAQDERGTGPAALSDTGPQDSTLLVRLIGLPPRGSSPGGPSAPEGTDRTGSSKPVLGTRPTAALRDPHQAKRPLNYAAAAQTLGGAGGKNQTGGAAQRRRRAGLRGRTGSGHFGSSPRPPAKSQPL